MKDRALQMKGLDHINFACSDMDRTVQFWESLGVNCKLKLVLHNPERFHLFFDMGKNSSFSYWYWPSRKMQAAASHRDPHHAGFYHLAFHVDSEEELEEMHRHVRDAGVAVSDIAGRHLFDKSFYFEDPDGIQFEFACPVLNLEGTVDHDGNGTLTPLSSDVKIGRRRLDGPVRFETKYK